MRNSLNYAPLSPSNICVAYMETAVDFECVILMKTQEMFYLKSATADYFSVKLQGERSNCQLTELNMLYL